MKTWLKKRLDRLQVKFFHLRNNFFWLLFRPWYYFFKRVICEGAPKLQPDNDAIAFYAQNAGRVAAVTGMFADARDKLIFEKIIRFRQTYAKCDYPPCERKPQYFHVFQFGNDEAYIDCGAYMGDTLDEFIKNCPRYKHIAAFEPENANFQKLQARYAGKRDVTLLNIGAYDKEGTLFIKGRDAWVSVATDGRDGAAAIRVNTIDNLGFEKVTFIKMDIEGAELNALKGAEKTILRDKPKLAICIYHSNEDTLHIAEYIHHLVPEYRFRVRQYNCYPYIDETVLYAHIP